MKRKINKKIVDYDGYKEDNEQNFTDYKVIPTNNISMKDVKETILGIMLDSNGNPQGFEFMEPGEEYNFSNSSAVVEIPKYQGGGGYNAFAYQSPFNYVSPFATTNTGVASTGTNPAYRPTSGAGAGMASLSRRAQAMAGTKPANPNNPVVDPAVVDGYRLGLTEDQTVTPNQPDYSNLTFRPDSLVPPTTAPNLGNVPAPVNPWDDPAYATAQNNLIIGGEGDNPTMSGAESREILAQQNQDQYPGDFQFINPYGGVDIPTAAVTLGTSIEEGNTLGTIASSLKLATGLGRNVASGLGLARRNKNVMQGYRNNQRDYITGANRPVYMEEGGKVEKALTGEFLFGMDKVNPMVEPNAEIEHGEYVQHPDNEIQQAVGDTHEKGGMDVALEEGTRILSDHLKLGGTTARMLKKQFDLELKATDTYATVLDKFNRKSGLHKIVTEQEDVIKRMDKQQKNTKDEDSLGLNMQYLSGKMKELEDKKKPLESARKVLFDAVYKEQEKSKPKDKRDETVVFENGGEIKALAAKYGIPADRVQDLIKKYQGGGNVDISRYYRPLGTNTGNFNRQRFTEGTNLSGAVTPDEAVNRLRAQSQTLPYLVQRSGLAGTYDFGQIPELLRDPSLLDANGNPIITQANPQNTQAFQVGYDEYLKGGYGAIQANPYLSAEEKQTLTQKLQTEQFGDGVARDYDQIYGDFTSSRSGFSLPVLTQKDKELYGDKIKFVGDALTPEGAIKEEFAGLDPATKEYLKNIYDSQGQKIFDIGVLDVPQPSTASGAKPVADLSQDVPVGEATELMSVQQEQAARRGAYLMPEQNPLPPTGLQPHLKVNRRFDRVDPALISPEQNIEEIRRQEASAIDQINSLPDSQRRAALANLNANTQQNINKAVSETARVNSQIQSQADMQNAQTQRMEENAAAQDALSYEQRQLRALAVTQNDFANFYNTQQANNVRNFNTINNLNLMNAMYDDFQFTGDGIEKTSPDLLFTNPMNKIPSAQSAEKKKVTKKKFGGRFKK